MTEVASTTLPFKQALKSAGLPDIRVHDLRHSHAPITLLLETYSHVIPTSKEEVARNVDDLMN